MRIRTVTIDADVEQVLRAATLDGNNMILNSQLSPAMYKKVMKVAELIGFKWNRKLKCHTGEGDSANKLREALNGGKIVDEKKTFQFYATPEKVADRLVDLAGIQPNHRVLEPSAGDGAILKAIMRLPAERCPNVLFACELNEKYRNDAIRNADGSINGSVELVGQEVGYDFLKVNGKYDRIIMNPPFCNLQDCDHVRHAYELLTPNGKVVAIMSKSWEFNSARKAKDFRDWLVGMEHETTDLPAGTFSESGTEIASVIVTIHKPRE